MGLILLTTCSVSYKLDGALINYDLTKTISVSEFPNQAEMVYPTLSQTFTQELRNKFITQTRLKMVPNNADLHLEGEITNYTVTGSAIKEDGYTSQTRLTITVKVRYTNEKKPNEDFEQSFSAYSEFESTQSLESVQDQQIKIITEDIIDQIYNATVGNW